MTIEIIHHPRLLPYEQAVEFMENRVADIIAGNAKECLWFVQHTSLYTAGTSAKDTDLLSANFPVYKTGRGGEYTYHGPGQRVVYAMLDLKQRHDDRPDLKKYVWQLEEWIIQSLNECGIEGERRQGRVGIWVVDKESGAGDQGSKIEVIQKRGKQAASALSSASWENQQIFPEAIEKSESKIAAIGIRVRKWVTYHGIAINLNPDLSHFSGIIPCGIKEYGVTSLKNEGVDITMDELDKVLESKFLEIF